MPLSRPVVALLTFFALDPDNRAKKVSRATTGRLCGIALVYWQSFRAGHCRPLASQLETAVVAGAGHGIGGFGRDRQLLPLFRQHLPVRREIPARDLRAIPLDGVQQNDAPLFLVLPQLKCRAA